MLTFDNDYDINSLVESLSLSDNMHVYYKNNIYLTQKQIDKLDYYNIPYKNCNSVNELLFLISGNEDLDDIALEISEFNYYHNTNK